MGSTGRRDDRREQRRADRRFMLTAIRAGRKVREDTDTRTAIATDTALLATWTRHHMRIDPNSAPSIPTELARRRLLKLIERSERQLQRRGTEPRLIERAESELQHAWREEHPGRTLPEETVIIAVENYDPEWVHPAAWVLRERYFLCGERYGVGDATIRGLLRLPRYVRDLIEARETRWLNEHQSALADPPSVLRATAPDLDETELESLRGIWSSEPDAELNDLHEAIAAVRLLV